MEERELDGEPFMPMNVKACNTRRILGLHQPWDTTSNLISRQINPKTGLTAWLEVAILLRKFKPQKLGTLQLNEGLRIRKRKSSCRKKEK